MRVLAALLTITLLTAGTAGATDYYVSSSGHDNNSGSSPADAWLTIQRVNSSDYNPGDRILFEGGRTFSGNLYFDGADAGTPTAPVTIGSYGSGRATIYAGDGDGILIYNAAGFVIRDLYIVGSGRTTNTGDGIFFFNDLAGAVKLPYVRIDHVDTVLFGDYGILIGAHNGNSGYRDVRISYTLATDNQMGGIFTYAQNPNVHEDVRVTDSSAFNNSGKAGLLYNSGNGIALSSVNGGSVERSVAHDNGYLSDAGNGPVGIWAFNSTRITLQYNESFHNRTGGEKDGGGFCFDLNTSASVMQFNYSHDNAGAGYLLAHKPDTYAHTGNVVRYNVSENDGRDHDYAGIQTWGRIVNAEIYNNTIYVAARTSSTSGSPRGILIKNSSLPLQDPDRLHFRNNIIQSAGGVRLVEVQASALDQGTEIRFEGNDYFSSGGTFRIVWGGTTYSSLSAWRTATGQERLNGRDVGLAVDPELARPNTHLSFNNANMITGLYGYRLKPSSLLIDAGLDLRTLGIAPGTLDYFGGGLPFNGAFDVGAHEYRVNCTWSISPGSVSAAAPGAAGTISVTAPDATCGWAALPSATWIGVTAGEFGGGSGSVGYWVAANNTTAARTGSIKVADQTFTIAQAAPAGSTPGPVDIVLYAASAPVIAGRWSAVTDSSAAGGARLQNPNVGAAKIVTALASPADYFEMTFTASAGQRYHLWMRGKATSNGYANDSVHVQFDKSVNASGAAVWRIGTTSSTEVNLEDCSGCGVSGWGWQDNGYAALGGDIYFAASGTQTIRVQVREDGFGIDQIVLSPANYLTTSPGTLKNDTHILPR